MYGSKIHKDNGYDANSYTYYPVAIIGAGESGIAMGCRLKEELGFDQFRIFDRHAGIGGTWWINRYPGVACDVPAVFYSFSFSPNHDWTTFHPSGEEIVKYCQEVCEKYEIVDKIQLNTDVSVCRWDNDDEVWDITLHHLIQGTGDLSVNERNARIKEQGPASVYLREEKIRAKVLISAVGNLVEPKTWPKDIPGKERFQGQIFHSARWRHDVDLKGKDVIVVGTGCSAAQFVPQLTQKYGANSVTQLMRSPPWVEPRLEPPGGEVWWEKWAPFLNNNIPLFNRLIRTSLFAGGEFNFRLFGSSEYSARERKKYEKDLLEHMKRKAPVKYHEMLTPNYGVCCKRRIFDATWLPGLNDSNIELTTLPLTNVGEKTVTLGPGRYYPDPEDTASNVPNHQRTIPADVIILANGFEMTKWLHGVDLIGRDGKNVQKMFEERGGAGLYMCISMDNYPNFFAIAGPNTITGHSSVILATENTVNFTLKLIKPILEGSVTTIEPKKEAEENYIADMQKSLKKMVWSAGGCRTWYTADSGWNSTVYPYTQIWFTILCMFPKYSDWNVKYTPKGLRKKRRNEAMRYLALLLVLGGIYRARKAGHTIAEGPTLLRGFLRTALRKGVEGLQWLSSRV